MGITIGVRYEHQDYAGMLRPAEIEVTGDGRELRIAVKGRGYSCAEKSSARIFEGWLALPRDLAREVGEQLVKLSEGPAGKWRKDYPEEAERQRKERSRELESAIRQLRGQEG